MEISENGAMEGDCASRIAVVSGGGTGIGRAIAHTLACEGYEVFALGRRRRVLKEAAKTINDALGVERVRPLVADLCQPEWVAEAARHIANGTGTIDVVVNNAGGNFAGHPKADLEGMRDDWRTNFEGNVLPAVLLTHALLPRLRRPGGRIVTIGSIAAFRGPATYGGAKAALHPWSAELAVALAPEGISVNVVAPGYVTDTEFYGDRMGPELQRDRSGRAPAGRMGEPSEIAALVRYLAGPDAGFVTGQILQANGGALLGRG
jgi:3-oxoacyl-[acyl-carrier protein] reductase